MHTQITKNDDIIIVRLQGIADTESIADLDQTCQKYLMQKKVIFNLADLNFVGSSGLSTLMKIIQNMTQQSKLKVCSVGCEFQRIFANSHLNHLHIYEDENSARAAFE